jgi:hypothetical protein
MQDDGLNNHTLARNDIDHFFQHETVEGLMNGSTSIAEESRYARLVDTFTRFKLASDDPMFDGLIGGIAQ